MINKDELFLYTKEYLASNRGHKVDDIKAIFIEFDSENITGHLKSTDEPLCGGFDELTDYINNKLNVDNNWFNRLWNEFNDLRNKIYKLETFLTTAKFQELDEVNKALLKAQLPAMKTYLNILDQRIKIVKLK